MIRREYYAQRRQLAAIRNAAVSLRDNKVAPRALVSGICGALACLGAWVTCGVYGLTIFSNEGEDTFTVLFIIVAAIILAFSICYRICPLAKSWSDVLDKRLAEYNPVSHAAYIELLAATVKNQGFDLSALFHWLEIESGFVRDLAPNPHAGTGKRFIEKSTSNQDRK